ncbi:hypothetical protein [Acidaminococcus massiliensis]|uniref:hypothetical protein n=1 Tax=Acidaminococcus massiliensis TaxID=1852375 RepID=UPI0023F0A4A7|nr:hypothetical protein [Acidaminococcus massiliensis]
MFKEAQIQVYGAMLNDIPPTIQIEAVKNVIKTSKFLPSIAAIREEAVKLARGSVNLEQSIPEREWEEVYKQIGSVGPYRQPVFTNPITRMSVKAMGWQMLCSSDEKMMPTLRSQFIKSYKEIADEQKTRHRVNRSLQEKKVQEITGGVLKALAGGEKG